MFTVTYKQSMGFEKRLLPVLFARALPVRIPANMRDLIPLV